MCPHVLQMPSCGPSHEADAGAGDGPKPTQVRGWLCGRNYTIRDKDNCINTKNWLSESSLHKEHTHTHKRVHMNLHTHVASTKLNQS